MPAIHQSLLTPKVKSTYIKKKLIKSLTKNMCLNPDGIECKNDLCFDLTIKGQSIPIEIPFRVLHKYIKNT